MIKKAKSIRTDICQGIGKQAAILIPGWATEAKTLFSQWPRHYDRIESVDTAGVTLLEQRVADSDDALCLVGVSLGAYIAVDMATKYPDKIQELHLISMRPQYPKSECRLIAKALAKNLNAGLERFYQNCLANPALLPALAEHDAFDVEALIEGLQRLSSEDMDTLLRLNCPIFLYHGQQDLIAPYSEWEHWIHTHKHPSIQGIVDEDSGHLDLLFN